MRDLSPKDLARSLGVSESSVKRWVDDGELAARRTAGGHRRIALAEAVRFVRHRGTAVPRPELILGAAAPAAPFDGTATAEVGERFFALLEQDDAAAARGLLLALYLSGWPVAAICDGPMRFAMEKIGTLWRHGPGGIVIEHRATDTCMRALAEMRALFSAPAPGAPVALGAGPAGDPYILPSLMAGAVLADLGWRDHNLGPEVPIPVLAQAAEQYRPGLVWLAMSVAPRDEKLAGAVAQLAAQLQRRGASLVLGGRGVPALKGVAGTVRVHSMAELAAFARGAAVAAAS